eukprot:2825108-Amphidinium_carterae.1
MPNCGRLGSPMPPETVGSCASLNRSGEIFSPTMCSKALSFTSCKRCSIGWRVGAGTALIKCMSTAGKKVRTTQSTIW